VFHVKRRFISGSEEISVSKLSVTHKKSSRLEETTAARSGDFSFSQVGEPRCSTWNDNRLDTKPRTCCNTPFVSRETHGPPIRTRPAQTHFATWNDIRLGNKPRKCCKAPFVPRETPGRPNTPLNSQKSSPGCSTWNDGRSDSRVENDCKASFVRRETRRVPNSPPNERKAFFRVFHVERPSIAGTPRKRSNATLFHVKHRDDRQSANERQNLLSAVPRGTAYDWVTNFEGPALCST